MTAAMSLCAVIALRLPPFATSREARPKSWKPFLAGVLAYALVLPVPFFLSAKTALPAMLGYFTVLAVFGGWAATAWRVPTIAELLMLTCGGETAQGLFGLWLATQFGNWLFFGVSTVSAVVFVAIAIRLERSPANEETPNPATTSA